MDGRKAYRICAKMREHAASWQVLWDEAVRYGRNQERPGNDIGQKSDFGEVRRDPSNTYVATRAEKLANGIFSNAINSGQKFFYLAPGGAREPSAAAKDWLHRMENMAVNALKGSNFIPVSSEVADDYVVLGTVPCAVLWEDGGVVLRKFSVQKGAYISTNNLGQPDTVCIFSTFTAKQAIQEFGEENVSSKVVESREDMNRVFEYVQLVYPKAAYGERVEKDRGDHRRFPVGSVYVECETKRVVKEEGFSTFPFACPRWKVAHGETYGRSPVTMAVADARSLNRVEHDIADLATLAANPPIAVPPGCEDFKMIPNYANKMPGNDVRNSIWVFQPETNLQLVDAYVQRRMSNIDSMCLSQAFSPLGDEVKSNVSVYEASQRMHLHAQAISSYVVRFQRDFLEKVIRRVIMLLVEHEQIERPPQELISNGVKIKYISPIDAQLNQGEVSKVMNGIMQLSEVFRCMSVVPDAHMNEYLDEVKLGLFFLRSNGVPENLLRDERTIREALKAARERDAQTQASMLQAQMVKPVDLQKAPQEGSILGANA